MSGPVSPASPSKALLITPNVMSNDMRITLIKTSRQYQHIELIKETIYQTEGFFPGQTPRFVCHACQGDDSVAPREKSLKYASKEGLIHHIQGSFHSPCSRWRRVRKQAAYHSAAAVRTSFSNNPLEPMTLTSARGNRRILLKTERISRRRLKYYCPYTACRANEGRGWSNIHELVAHIQGSNAETEGQMHEQEKRADGWGAETWLRNDDAERMIKALEKKYPVDAE